MTWMGVSIRGVSTAGGASPGSDIFYLEQSDWLSIYGSYVYCPNGRSDLYMDGTYAPTNYVTLNGIDGDVGTYPQFGICFSTSTATPSYWHIEKCRLPNTLFAMGVAGSSSAVTIDNFRIKSLIDPGNNGINIPGILQNSVLDLGATPLNAGFSNNNQLTGFSDRWTIGSRTADHWSDTGTLNKTISQATQPTFLLTSAGITSSGGALVANARLALRGQCLDFQVILASTSGNLAITANSTVTLFAPGGQSLGPVAVGTGMAIDQVVGTCNGVSVISGGSNPVSTKPGAVIGIPVPVTSIPHTDSLIITGSVYLS